MGFGDLFEETDEESSIPSSEEGSSTTDESDGDSDSPSKKITDVEIYDNLYKKAFKKRDKKSVFFQVDNDILTDIGKLIATKKMSYKKALDKIKELYSDNENICKIKTSHTLRHFLITKGYVNNEKALETINKSISKSGFAKTKRERITNDVVDEIINNRLEDIITHPTFKDILKTVLKENPEILN